MTRYLVAAEADKIQDLIFRSARLREVVGSSMLLTRFCEEGVAALTQSSGTRGEQWDTVVNDGGSFRIWFADENQAIQFGNNLTELYRRVVDGSLSVASEPVAYDENTPGDFARANQSASEALQQAKRTGQSINAAAHIPQMAFCASCGIGIASQHAAIYEREIYLCPSCRSKANEGSERFRGIEKSGLGKDEFFTNFFRTAVRLADADLAQEELAIPAEIAEAVGSFDTRNYVAYLLADGNSMGALFRQCSEATRLQALSNRIAENTAKALAAPVKLLMQRTAEIAKDRQFKPGYGHRPYYLKDILPAVPLIMGGDDIFALIAAPYALDFARVFCLEYENLMSEALSRPEISLSGQPTLSVSVVICKSNYPYSLAHEIGETLLKQVKRFVKTNLSSTGSALAFTVITGNDIAPSLPEKSGAYRGGLNPYWINDKTDPAGLPLKKLIEVRHDLIDVPQKRLVQLEELYRPASLPKSRSELTRWSENLEHLLKRIDRVKEHGEKTRAALAALGDPSQDGPGFWKDVNRYGLEPYYGHALPNLLSIWNYAYDLEKPFPEYAPEEEQ
jgi:hypothetical protein